MAQVHTPQPEFKGTSIVEDAAGLLAQIEDAVLDIETAVALIGELATDIGDLDLPDEVQGLADTLSGLDLTHDIHHCIKELHTALAAAAAGKEDEATDAS